MNDKLKKIFEGQELSPEFTTQLDSVFESILKEKEAIITEALEAKIRAEIKDEYTTLSEDYAAYVTLELTEKFETRINEELVPKIDEYLALVAEEYAEDNKQALVKISESNLAKEFLAGITSITEKYNLVIPEGNDDAVSKLQESLDNANKSVNTILESKNKLEKELKNLKRTNIFESVVDGLADTQKEKIASVSESIDYKDDEQFKTAMKTLVESYYPSKEKLDKAKIDESEVDKKIKDLPRIDECGDPYFDQLFKNVK